MLMLCDLVILQSLFHIRNFPADQTTAENSASFIENFCSNVIKIRDAKSAALQHSSVFCCNPARKPSRLASHDWHRNSHGLVF